MTSYRTDKRDVNVLPKNDNTKPGTLPDHRIPVYDHKKRMRGHVGPKATPATVARFTGQHGSKLGKVDGRQAWISPPPPPPKKPQVDPTALAVAETQAKAPAKAQKIEIQVSSGGGPGSAAKKQAMGSASKKKPTKPEASARPRRG